MSTHSRCAEPAVTRTLLLDLALRPRERPVHSVVLMATPHRAWAFRAVGLGSPFLWKPHIDSFSSALQVSCPRPRWHVSHFCLSLFCGPQISGVLCSCMPSSPVRKVPYPLASLSDIVSLQDSPVASSTTGVPNQGASNRELLSNQQGCISPLTGTSPFQSHTPSPGRTFWGDTMVSVLVPWDLFSACSLFLSFHLFPSLSLQLPPQSTMRSPWD